MAVHNSSTALNPPFRTALSPSESLELSGSAGSGATG